MIPFNKPYLTGKELEYIADAHSRGMLAGNGFYSKKCISLIESTLKCPKALLTHSCTAALEMCAILLDIKSGDEVIMPSYTFVSTANAFALRGATPVFVDVEKNSMNIDPEKISLAITPRTKAIVVVHYAGHACDMNSIMNIANQHGIKVIEDAAQAFLSKSNERYLGTIGHLGCISFHETKNIISGEGGCLLINDHSLHDKADMVHEKGTDRTKFMQGLVDKYSWQTIGSSFLPGEIMAAFLYAQLEESHTITQKRREIWSYYHKYFCESIDDVVELPSIDLSFENENAHMYSVKVKSFSQRGELIKHCLANHISPVFHYVPLHNSTAGLTYCRSCGSMANTEQESKRLLRLPLWIGIDADELVKQFKKSLVLLN